MTETAVLELLLAAVRRSMVACRVECGGAGAGWAAEGDEAAVDMEEKEIGFDRFHGFLSLPVEFEVEMLCRVPSARLLFLTDGQVVTMLLSMEDVCARTDQSQDQM